MRKSQEPRLTAHYAQDEAMLKAYEEDKDLYSVIAQSMYNNRYEDNLEFHQEFKELIVDGKTMFAGTDAESTVDVLSDNTVIVPCCYYVTTTEGFKSASDIDVGDVLITDEGNISIVNIINHKKNNECQYDKVQFILKK